MNEVKYQINNVDLEIKQYKELWYLDIKKGNKTARIILSSGEKNYNKGIDWEKIFNEVIK